MFKLFMISVVAISVTAPVAARPQGDKKPTDPNRTVCRTTEMIGSRLQTQKTCMTAMQWDQLEREQRATVDRVQAFKPQSGN